MNDMFRDLGQKMDSGKRDMNDQLTGIRAQLKGVIVHLDDIEV